VSEWEETPFERDESPTPPFVMVTTSMAVPISVRQVADDRTPDDAVCLGTFYDGRLIARCVVPPEAITALQDHALFEAPVHLGLLGYEESPGLQCRLLAFVDADRLPPDIHDEDEDGEEEPWKASVPPPAFEADQTGAQPLDMGEPAGTVPVLLGHIVRLERDRKHPGDLAREAMDILATILSGKVSEVVDRVLDELLDGEDGGPPAEGEASDVPDADEPDTDEPDADEPPSPDPTTP